MYYRIIFNYAYHCLHLSSFSSQRERSFSNMCACQIPKPDPAESSAWFWGQRRTGFTRSNTKILYYRLLHIALRINLSETVSKRARTYSLYSPALQLTPRFVRQIITCSWMLSTSWRGTSDSVWNIQCSTKFLLIREGEIICRIAYARVVQREQH